jgi:uncharacterized damage-inducible protein DinB
MNFRDSIRSVLIRELNALKRELEAYDDESDIWRTPAGISNSAGTLALHLAGNLQAFVGAVLGDSGYERDRQVEFSRRDVPLSELISELDRTILIVDSTLQTLPDDRLQDLFPLVFGAQQVGTADFLVHLSTHLSFHLGQVDYHRRLVTGNNLSIDPQAISDLASAATTG